MYLPLVWLDVYVIIMIPRLGIPKSVTSVRKIHVGLYVKCPLLRSDCNQNYNVSTDFSEISQYQIS
jgi:hypothetical protein